MHGARVGLVCIMFPRGNALFYHICSRYMKAEHACTLISVPLREISAFFAILSIVCSTAEDSFQAYYRLLPIIYLYDVPLAGH
jgi:hypothetical protein